MAYVSNGPFIFELSHLKLRGQLKGEMVNCLF